MLKFRSFIFRQFTYIFGISDVMTWLRVRRI